MGGVQNAVTGKFSGAGEAAHLGEVGIQRTGNIQLVEVNIVLVESDHLTACNNDLVCGNISAEGLIAIESQGSVVFISVTLNEDIGICNLTVNAHVGRTVQVDITGTVLFIGREDTAFGVNAESIGIEEFEGSGIDCYVAGIAAGDCNIVGFEGGFTLVAADGTVIVVNDNFGVCGIAACHCSGVGSGDAFGGVAANESIFCCVGEGQIPVNCDLGLKMTVVVDHKVIAECSDFCIDDFGIFVDGDFADVTEFFCHFIDMIVLIESD